MKLYHINTKRPVIHRQHVCQGGSMTGGYVPLLLGPKHGAGVSLKPETTLDMSKAKSLLAGLSVGKPKKKFISI